MNVRCIPAGPLPTNAYLLTEPRTGEAVLVDAPEGVWEQVEPILEAEGCTLRQLWLTHGHWDHTQGAAEVVRRTGAEVLGHPDDRPLYETPEVMRTLLPPELVPEPVTVTRWLSGGERLQALGEAVEVAHVPGHCPGSLMFYLPGRGAALVGDALFRGNVGRTDLPGADPATLARSIRERIYVLPEATAVLPGHGGPTTVAAERATNPYVRG